MPTAIRFCSLALVIELLLDGGAEIGDNGAKAAPAANLRVLVEEGGDLGQHLEVVGDLAADVGPLHLDHDVAAVAKRRHVDLAQGRGGEGLLVETGRTPWRPCSPSSARSICSTSS